MKAVLEFDLNDKDEKMAHFRAIKSLDMACALFDIIHNIKRECEREVEKDNDTSALDAVDIVFEKIQVVLENNNIQIEELID